MGRKIDKSNINIPHFLKKVIIYDYPVDNCDITATQSRLLEMSANIKDRKKEDVEYFYSLDKHDAGFEIETKNPHFVDYDSVQSFANCDYRNDLNSSLDYCRTHLRQNIGDVASVVAFMKMDSESQLKYLANLRAYSNSLEDVLKKSANNDNNDNNNVNNANNNVNNNANNNANNG